MRLTKKNSCRSGGKNDDDETLDRILVVVAPLILEVKRRLHRLARVLVAACWVDYAGTASCKLLVSSLTIK